LFNFAIDPLLWILQKTIVLPSLGKALACADDIGVALQELIQLIALASTFELFEKVSGLKLKPRKCVLILTSIECNAYNVGRVRAWLQIHVPAWENIQIANTAKYLGVFLGPGAV